MYAACMEHVELAIDRFVDEYEDAPDLIDLEQEEQRHAVLHSERGGEWISLDEADDNSARFKGWAVPDHCHQCAKKARFLIVHRDAMKHVAEEGAE